MLNRTNLNEIRKIVSDEVRKHLGGLYNDVLPKTIKDANGRLLKDIEQNIEQKIINLKQDITNYISKVEGTVKQLDEQVQEILTPQEPTEEGGLAIGAFRDNLIRNAGFLNYAKRQVASGELKNIDTLDYWNISVPNSRLLQILEFPEDPAYEPDWGVGPAYIVYEGGDLDEFYQDIEINALQSNTIMAFSCLSGSYDTGTRGLLKTPKIVLQVFDLNDNLIQTEEFVLNSNMEFLTDYVGVVGSGKAWKSNFFTFELLKEARRLRLHIVGAGKYDGLMLWSGDKPKRFEFNPADMVDGVNDELERLALAVQFAQLQVDLSDLKTTAARYMTVDQWRDLFEKDVTILRAKAFRIITDKMTIGDQELQTQIDINALGIETLVSASANYLYVGDNNGDYVKNTDGSFSYVGWASSWTGGYEPPDSNGYGNGDYILASGSHSRITQLSDRIVLAVDNSGKVATLALGSNTYGSIISIDADQINISGTTAFIGSDLSTCTIDGGAIEADTVIARVAFSGSALEIDSASATINHPVYGTITPKAVFGATLDPADTDATRLTIDNLGRIWSGAVDFASAKFSVDENGNLEAINAQFFGELWVRPTGSPIYDLYFKFASGNSTTGSNYGFYIMGDYYTTPENAPTYTRLTDTLIYTGGNITGGSITTKSTLSLFDLTDPNGGYGKLKVNSGDLIYVDPQGNEYVIQAGVGLGEA